ncbi:MAG TPA: ATP-binding protein [Thermoanaerobaculia bacterium]
MDRTIEVAVAEVSQVGEARRLAAGLAADSGLPEEDIGRASIVVTELGTNLVTHARGGSIVLGGGAGRGAIDVVALDSGPGMHLGAAMRDGFSTAGTMGHGLGAVQRQSDLFEVHTNEGTGTAVLARVVAGRRTAPAPWYAAVSAPYAGERENGDCWGAWEVGNGVAVLFIADGLGHGILASEAARAAFEVVARFTAETPGAIASRVHGALRATRGAAIGVARLDRARGELVFCGIGNIAGTIIHDGRRRSIVSMHGIAGHQAADFREFSYDLARGSIVVLHSDGISAKWDLAQYGAVLTRDPALIAGLIWRDFRRTNDDATVLVARV